MDWFLYDNGLRHERVTKFKTTAFISNLLTCSNNYIFTEMMYLL